MELRLTPVQVRNRLILVARRIVADHAPDAEGICRTCGVLHCEALAAARGYLARVEQPRRPLVVEIHRRAAVPPPGVTPGQLRTAARLRAGADESRPDGRGGRQWAQVAGGEVRAGGYPSNG
ncbi:hypothetical protein ABNF97_03150 [Plantactinospora sp. B6F1]|uniref:hypothetical protein n=1 Tax=Plantactinospora sp. B6F1 TaxID=3158971 RepID=UPI00102AC114